MTSCARFMLDPATWPDLRLHLVPHFERPAKECTYEMAFREGPASSFFLPPSGIPKAVAVLLHCKHKQDLQGSKPAR